MANPKHLEILKQGAKVWNAWRDENPNIRPNLSFASLYKTDLGGMNFSNAKLNYATLLDTNLDGANLNEARLVRANLSRASLNYASLIRAKLEYAILAGAKCFQVNLDKASLRHADLRKSNLGFSNLSASFDSAILCESFLLYSSFQGAKLYGADLTGAYLHQTDFGGASVGMTKFNYNNLAEAKGLDTVKHFAPSTIGIDTIYESQGNIPEVFLRGCGVPEDFITYIRSLTIQPIQFYSCFISYSSKNHDFAERLHADLQNKDVRCWFAPEDLKIGDRFRDRIDESIRLHDKLLIVLSENSVASPWVNDEVESAIEREHREGRTVLFPIKIDEAVTESTKAWAATIRRTRHIGDFTRWKEHDSYSKAFERLLRDLKAEGQRA
jgi:uncharacterized protein YjbI with pentapeptide repeats